MAEQPFEAIEKIGESQKISGLGSEQVPKIEPNREHFNQLMTEQSNQAQQAEYSRQHQEQKGPEQTAKVEEHEARTKTQSLDELARDKSRIVKLEKARTKNLLSQTKSAQEMLSQAKEDLATPNVKVNRATQRLLRNKLSHIDESLKVALSTVGADYVPPVPPAGLATPVEKFLGYLTHSQSQIESLGGFISKMEANADGSTLSASQMLTLQLKVGFIQQEVELFVSLLNKSLESIKTLMNVQI